MVRAVAIGIASLLSLYVGLSAPRVARAQTTWQLAGAGDFFAPGNWSAGVPTVGTAAVIDQGTAEAGGATQLTMADIALGSALGTSGSLIVNGADLLPNKVEVGKFGSGLLTVNSGYLDTQNNNSIFVGGNDDAGGTDGVGTMNMNGGYVGSTDDIQFGRNGHGTLNFTGGVMRGSFTVIGKFGTGVWNQSGGVYSQIGGDFEVGDGGNTSQVNIPGPREGLMTLSGGVIQTYGRFAMGNRVGSSDVTISGGALALTRRNATTQTLSVGLGDAAFAAGTGGPQRLRIVGDDAIVAMRYDFEMNPKNVFESATLVAEITGPMHTPILAGRNATIGNGILEVVLNGYVPQSGDSWTLIQAGADLTEAVAGIDAMVAAQGPLDLNGDGAMDDNDVLTHYIPSGTGVVTGQFKEFISVDAPLAEGLEWLVDYSDPTAVVLRVTGDAAGLVGDYNDDGIVNLADYTVWRDNLGASITLPGEAPGTTPGEVTAEDYTEWKNAFGNSNLPSELAASPAAVPEPSAIASSAIALLMAGAVLRYSRTPRS